MAAQADGPLLVWVTTDDPVEAGRLARGAVAERLAASAHVTPTRSCYRWQGDLHEADEHLVALRTRRSVYAALEAWIRARHHYVLPEIIALPIAAGLEPYLDWIVDATRS